MWQKAFADSAAHMNTGVMLFMMVVLFDCDWLKMHEAEECSTATPDIGKGSEFRKCTALRFRNSPVPSLQVYISSGNDMALNECRGG